MIHLLDEATINKIAAGEVIERPASVVKELIDNSIDAGATQIRIEVEQGGLKSIRIIDNGAGISKEDLPLAPVRHATSKISRLEDIYAIDSMGFRGEALASICHVASLEIISKIASDDAYQIYANPQISVPKPTNHTQGTTIFVQDLFQKLPVRRKFLKSPATEFTYIYEIVQRYALIYPQVDFVLVHNFQEVLNTTGISDLSQLVAVLFEKEVVPYLIAIDQTVDGISLKGVISSPQWTAVSRHYQVISINHRLIKNSVLHKAIQKSFEEVIPPKRFPLIVLNIDIAPNLIDINIHPQKTDVKFLNSGTIFDVVSLILKQKFSAEVKRQKFDDVCMPMLNEVGEQRQGGMGSETGFWHDGSKTELPFFVKESVQPTEKNLLGEYFQIFDTYLVFKTDDGIFVLDQHAAHERILYEKIKEKSAQALEQQLLLIPDIIELEPHYYLLALQAMDLLKQFQFDIDDFGNNQLIVRAIPMVFMGIRVGEFIKLFLESIQEIGFSKEVFQSHMAAQIENYQMSACKAAIKAGQTMHLAEIVRLMNDLVKAKTSYTCPHGRPLFAVISRHDLEKMFKRIV